MLSAVSSALIAGSVPHDMAQAPQHVRVLRSFLCNGKPTKVGTVIEVSASTAAELVYMRKAEIVVPAPKPAAPQPKPEPAKDAK